MNAITSVALSTPIPVSTSLIRIYPLRYDTRIGTRMHLFYIFTLSFVFIVRRHKHVYIDTCVKRTLKGRTDRARDKSIKTHFSRLILPLYYAWDHKIYYIIYVTVAPRRQPFSSHVFPKTLRHFTCTFFSCVRIPIQ